MIRINLLPHRELKRAARQRQFIVLAGSVIALAAVVVVAGYTVISRQIENQNGRNKFLETEVANLDKQIEEIKKLREQTQVMLARKKVVETLQSDRSDAVHLFDQMVRQLPEGIYLKSIKQSGNKVVLTGLAQSNARVSTLMRNFETSPWLENPNLIEIKVATVGNVRLNEFTLNVDMAKNKLNAADKSKPSPKAVKK